MSKFLLVGIGVGMMAVTASPFFNAHAASAIEVWWPTDGAKVTGTQPFKALVKEFPVEQYELFWQVDGGQWNWMDNSYTNYPHKEAGVGVGGWNWRGSGPYTVNFIARKSGTIIGERSIKIYIDNGQTTQTTQSVTQPTQPPPQLTVSAPVVTVSSSLYVDPNTPAAKQAKEWRTSRATDAALMDVLAGQATAKWVGGWSNIKTDVEEYAAKAQALGKTAVFVIYNIPGRDCGGYSAGGTTASAYTSWVQSVANAINGKKAIVVLEPDALANITCLPSADQQNRLGLLSSAVDIFKSKGAKVYLDAGHSAWIDANTMAARLNQANVAHADGFALNVSNFQTTQSSTDFGTKLSQLVGGKHFVIDTSRNGKGSNGEWCNPSGRSIGNKPTTSTGNSVVDAYLWIKYPGESDGSCNGAPGAGQWWPDYALGLVKNAQ